MSGLILETKLFIPPTRPRLVHRSRLIERLNRGLNRKLTLISAPAGFGKTTLLSDWVDGLRNTSDELNAAVTGEPQLANQVVWLTLDEADNDLTRLLTYLVTAVDRMNGSIASFRADMLAMLHTAQASPTEEILISLLNEVASVSNGYSTSRASTAPYGSERAIVLVLDDYHVIESTEIDKALAFLIEHTPPQLHLVIATRADPNLPLGRLRAGLCASVAARVPSVRPQAGD